MDNFPAWSSINDGIPSETLATMLSNAPVVIDPLFNAARLDNIVAIWGGTNDLFLGTGTPTTIYNDMVSYCSGRRIAGFKVIVLTILPRTQGGTPGSFEADRQTLNANIRANWATFADALADVGNDANVGQAGQSNDTTYYNADKVHMNNTGYGVIAGYVTTAINAIK